MNIENKYKRTFYKKIKVNTESGCWEWQGSIHGGYGYIRVMKNVFPVHRFSYLIHFGNIKAGYSVSHKCKLKSCSNPEHLILNGKILHGVDPRKRFLSKVKQVDGGCWEWQGSKTLTGYGNFGFEKKIWRAHRYSYKIFKGNLLENMEVCHKCDNPPCVNPDHLFLGTHKENMNDASKKGRFVLPVPKVGEDHYRAKLKPEQVIEIRKLYKTTKTSQDKLAVQFNVKRGAIKNIVAGRTWKHLL